MHKYDYIPASSQQHMLTVTFKLALQIARAGRGHIIDLLMAQFNMCI